MSIYDYDKDEIYIDVPYEFWDKLDKWFEWLEKEEQYLSTYKHNRGYKKCRKLYYKFIVSNVPTCYYELLNQSEDVFIYLWRNSDEVHTNISRSK